MKSQIFDGNNSNIYNEFLGEQFDVISYTSNALKVSSISSSITTLEESTNELNIELNEKVKNNYEELFKQANNLKDMEDLTDSLKQGVDNLETSINRMKLDIGEPFNKVSLKIKQLERVQYTCELLRKIIRYLTLVKKLKSNLQSHQRDLSKAAQSIAEIQVLYKENDDLIGIDIIDLQVEWVRQCSDQVNTIASSLLSQALENQNQSLVANSLQVFYNMGTLNDRVNSLLSSMIDRIQKSIKTQLTLGISSTATTSKQTQSSLNTPDRTLHQKLEVLFDIIYNTTIECIHLQRVLAKIKDQNTHKPLLEYIKINDSNNNGSGTISISNYLWKSIIKLLEVNFIQSSKNNAVIDNTLTMEYPRISRILLDSQKKLQSYCDLAQQQQQLQVSLSFFSKEEQRSSLLMTIAPFEKQYLDRAYMKMTNLLNSGFQQSTSQQSSWTRATSGSSGTTTSVPTGKQMVELSKIIWSEIEILIGHQDESLLLKMTKIISKVLDSFAVKVESMLQQQQLSWDSIDFRQAPPSSGHQLCFSLFNATMQLCNSIQSLLISQTQILKSESYESIDQSIGHLQRISTQILTPLFNSFQLSIQSVLMQMHPEDWSSSQPTKTNRYIDSLKDLLQQFQHHYLCKFTPCLLLNQHRKSLISGIIVQFLRNCSLLKPISESGKLRLANDFVSLELALTPLFQEGIREVGEPYQWLRSYKQFMFRDHQNIESFKLSPELHSLPLLIVLQNLISRGPKELQPPHLVANLSLTQYFHWLNTHKDDEILRLFRLSMDNYVQVINDRKEKEFSPIYLILLSLLPVNKK
ncbi:oligomeric Golgi complex component [Tieghemostelium lacteum]|uniref:Conserved oligomeric Golgi complex subunit 5 n=1 Tax=Tieghemostelium lacteum TaxID=361077 RepID=A0A151Z7B8_TIELA|nr:oligomeric Golgi complex component [Tieghemostelium lacteum]|eukprot:KYQ89828.1 oligomeric Golgi complex component [Tieghemostelium lacteum]